MDIVGHSEPHVKINVVPLVDICLVLVIIFMVTAPLLHQSNLPVDLPKASSREIAEVSKTTITVTRERQWAIDSAVVAKEKVQSLLAKKIKKSRDKLVVIRIDREAKHEDLMEAMRLAKISGAASITIATERKE